MACAVKEASPLLTLIPFLILLIIMVSAAVLFKKSFACTAAFSLFCVILLQYVVSLCFGLSAGFYATFALAAVCLGLTVWRVVRHGSEDLRAFALSPALLAYVIFIFVILFLSRNRVCYITDEYAHWGLVVKNMLYYDRFGFIAEATTAYKSYPPAGSLLPYFFARFFDNFRESAMYHGAFMLTFALLLPIFSQVKKGEWGRFLTLLLLAFFLPLPFYGYAYATLYVDVQLALVFGNLLLLYFTPTEDERFRILSIGLYSGMLTLLKDAGMGLAILAFGIYLADMLLRRKALPKPPWTKRNMWLAVAALGIALFCIGSWKVALAANGVKSFFSYQALAPSGVLSALKEGLSSAQYDTIQRFFVQHVYFRIQEPIPFSILMQLLVLLGLGLLLDRYRTDDRALHAGPKESGRIWLILLGYGVFAGVLLMSYLFIFAPNEATYLASFERYVYTYILGAFVYVVFRLAWRSSGKRLMTCFVLLCVWIYFGMSPFLEFMSPGLSREARAELGNMSHVAEALDPVTDTLGLITDEEVNARACAYFATPVRFKRHIVTSAVDVSPDMLADLLAETCTHVYLDDASDAFRTACAMLFPEGMTDGTLYRVVTTPDGVVLLPSKTS